MEKPLVWMGQSLKELRTMPDDVEDEIGYALHLAQNGGTSDSVTKMKGDLRDVMEIHVDEDGDTYRALYTTAMEDVVYVLDAFKKKSKKGGETRKADIERIRGRLKAARAHYAKYGAPKSKEQDKETP